MSGPTTSDPGVAGPLDRRTAEALLARADVLLAASEFDAARAHYARLVGFPDPAITGAALLGTGEALYRLDDEAGALWSWEQVTRLPENQSAYAAWRQVAAARVRAGTLRTAFQAYKEAERRPLLRAESGPRADADGELRDPRRHRGGLVPGAATRG